ncbi:TlpA family protein disulfide reductase [Sphingobacterium detergens]|uniref:TlpA family protein disulfide reductase n=1 Tax=Sphingobacterium detergens TaxID=1145106 RepID=UPI003AAB9EBF
MMKRFISLVILYFPLLLLGQTKGLKLGETMTFPAMSPVIRNASPTLVWDSVKSDLIVLDFLMTSCSSCIEALPKNQKLQQLFGDRIKIVPVTFERKEQVERFWNKNDYTKSNTLPVVVEDRDLKNLFPHQGVSHLVWIKNNKVLAITAGDMLTEKNILQALSSDDLKEWPIKDDFFVSDTTGKIMGDGFYSRFDGYVNGAKLQYALDTVGEQVRFRAVNVTPIPLFLYLYASIRELPLMKKERIKLAVTDSTRFIEPTDESQSIWMKNNAFTYESIWPISMGKEELINAIIADLANRLRLNVSLVDLPAEVWQVAKIKKKKNNGGDTKKEGMPLKFWLTLFEINYPQLPPILIAGNEMELIETENVSDFDGLRAALKKNNFSLQKTTKSILSLRITEIR